MALIDYSTKDRVGYITINRPEKRNALNQEMVDALSDSFSKAAADKDAKVIVLRAMGEAFAQGPTCLSAAASGFHLRRESD